MIKSPMLACPTQPVVSELQYPLYASFKLDGIRCITPMNQVLSRKLKPIPNKFVQNKLTGMPIGFDGELMVKGSFNDVDSAIMSFEGEPDFEYHVFDICDADPKMPFEKRYTKLQEWKAIFNEKTRIRFVEQKLCTCPKDVYEYYNFAIKEGYEGLILRSPKGLYKEGRSTLKQEWMLKVKPVQDTEATIIDCTELMHNDNDPEINNLGYIERNKQQAGMVGGNTLGALICLDLKGVEVKIGSGFTAAQRKEIWDNFDKYKHKIITFKYQDRTPDNAYRFPVFKGFRSD